MTYRYHQRDVARGRAGELQTSQRDFDILKNARENY